MQPLRQLRTTKTQQATGPPQIAIIFSQHLVSTLPPPFSFLLSPSFSFASSAPSAAVVCGVDQAHNKRQRDAICRDECLCLWHGIHGLRLPSIILLSPRRVVASPRNLFLIWSLTSFILWSYVSGRMAFTSIARTYANVNRDAPKSYWDYGKALRNHMRISRLMS